jgi:hypothetical protein
LTGPVLYSTNPWITYDIVTRYRKGNFFVWCSEYFDSSSAIGSSAARAIAPSSCPKEIYIQLQKAWENEDRHNALVKGYITTFKRLAKAWAADGSITKGQSEEIVGTVNSGSFKIWRPTLYVIPKSPIVTAGRLISVPPKKRAAYGPELQIYDLQQHEFDIIERLV